MSPFAVQRTGRGISGHGALDDPRVTGWNGWIFVGSFLPSAFRMPFFFFGLMLAGVKVVDVHLTSCSWCLCSEQWVCGLSSFIHPLILAIRSPRENQA